MLCKANFDARISTLFEFMSNIAENRRARFDYDILEKMEAGILLTGQEVKSVKKGSINLKGAYITFHNDKALLTNAHISKYPEAGPLPTYDPTHSRPLLLHKREISYLRGKSQEKGLTIIPLSVYTKNHLVKVEIGVGRGRKTHDKREVIKKRDQIREMRKMK